ncbi:MAG TPA: FAD-binding oxidoreductase [Actinomycetota bacterium]|nr:FAD-binding oxidoreductase [Actinomycetota bacterium]
MNSTRTDAPPRADRSWWLQEALAQPAFAGEPCPPLAEDLAADVVIVGGGYTGLWTAYFLKERDPGIEVVVLEQDICGGGPSGRNGGFVNGWWTSIGEMARRFGDADAMELCLAASRSVRGVGDFLRRHDIDAWWSPNGELAVASSPFHEGAWTAMLEEARHHGVEDEFEELTPSEVTDICISPMFGGGVLSKEFSTVQPARLARGLRRVVLERGVRIFEQTPVRGFGAGRPVVAETPGGTVRAGEGVLAVNAWGIHWKRLHPYVGVRGSYMVLTAPAPARLEEINWTEGQGIRDFRPSLHYLRTTPDGRIAFGCAGMQPGLSRRIGPRFAYDVGFLRRAVGDLHRMFPSFRDVPIEAGWGGPIDVAGLYLPFFGSFPSGTVHYGLGYTGNGVAPAHLGGQILASLALHAEDGFSRLALVTNEPLRLPPEPLLSPGMLMVNEAIRRKDDAEAEGRRAGPLTTFVARIPRRLGYNLGPR